MRAMKIIASAGILSLLLYFAVGAGLISLPKLGLSGYSAPASASAAEVPPSAQPTAEAAPAPSPSSAVPPPSKAERAIETTIAGGLSIKNETKYQIGVSELVKNGPSIKLAPGKPQILIIHTHSSEAYSPAGLDKYENSDSNRTEDKRYSVIRVGDELARELTDAGLSVIHDRGIYDYPSYTGSYSRSGAAVEGYLKKYPSIKIVIDLHRDAIGSGDAVYKTVAGEDGVCASQVMLLCGTDESGLPHPKWRENLKLALYIQDAVTDACPTLMRPVEIVPQRYNQHLTTGSLILEVGSNGNTLQEALAAVRLFGKAAGPALAELVE